MYHIHISSQKFDLLVSPRSLTEKADHRTSINELPHSLLLHYSVSAPAQVLSQLCSLIILHTFGGEPLLSSAPHLHCFFTFTSLRGLTNCGGRFILIFFHCYCNMLWPFILCHRNNWILKHSVTRDESSESVRQQCWTMALWRCSAVVVVVVRASSRTECYTFHFSNKVIFVSVSL